MTKIKIVSWTLKKEGNTRGKDWAIYEVIDSEGKKYGCFGSTLNAANVKENEEYLCEVETKKNGKFTNNTIKSISKPLNSVVAPNLGSVGGLEGNKSQLDRIEAGIQDIKSLLKDKSLPF